MQRKKKIADCGLRIADWEFSTPVGDRESSISNQQSAISNPRRTCRRGLSYLEVLIASGIALTGILALLALFPVAILNLQKGQVTDVVAAVGPSAIRGAQAVGVTDSSNWKAYNLGTKIWSDSGVPQSRPLPANLPAQPGMWLSLCFDPRFAAESSPATANGNFNPSLFPFKPTGNVDDVRMARLSLRGAPGTSNFGPMSITQARNLFKISDDLIFERPTDATLPSFQLPIERSDMAIMRRNYMAEYEYVITMTPNLRGIPVGYDPANPGLNPVSYVLGGAPSFQEPMPMDMPTEYTMSAVVFYKRQVQLNTYIPGDRDEPEAERVADVSSFWNLDSNSQAISGGDITIQSRTPIASAVGNELEIHQGDWVLLSGNTYSASAPRKFMGPQFQWYRVVSVNGDSYDGGAGYHRRDLTLDGPDWPAGLVASGTQLSIVSGVVGVVSMPVQVK